MLWSEVITKYGKEMADRMKKSQYLQGITVTIDRALCLYSCTQCGYETQIMKPGKELYTKEICPSCQAPEALVFKSFIDVITNIPERDIDLAYRDVNGEYINPAEWD